MKIATQILVLILFFTTLWFSFHATTMLLFLKYVFGCVCISNLFNSVGKEL